MCAMKLVNEKKENRILLVQRRPRRGDVVFN